MPKINLSENDKSKFVDKQFISISYNGKTNEISDTPSPTGIIEIFENGQFNVSQYATAQVNVPNPSTGELDITENGVYDVTEKASAVVNVPNPSTGSLSITANGEYDVTEYASVDVNTLGSMNFSDIESQDDNTIIATDDEGTEHEISYIMDDGRITSVTLDGKTQLVTYDGDVLTKIGNTSVDMESVPFEETIIDTIIVKSNVMPQVVITENE